MHRYSSLSDDFYVNMNLSTEMDLPTGRESVLQFFERLQKQFPTMSNFYSREKGDFILEADKDHGQYRWCTIEARRLCSGQVNPANVRHYVLKGSTLTLTVADAGGATTAASAWKKRAGNR